MKKGLILFSAMILMGILFQSMVMNDHAEGDPWTVPAKYEKMKNPYANAADGEKIGMQLYRKHCSSCHGKTGKGDGKKAETISTPMPDFTTDAFKGQSDGAIYYKTYVGRDEMPAFDKKIPDEEDQWKLINYVKTL